jgi:hypothetical protein
MKINRGRFWRPAPERQIEAANQELRRTRIVQLQPPAPALKKLSIEELAALCHLKCENGKVG